MVSGDLFPKASQAGCVLSSGSQQAGRLHLPRGQVTLRAIFAENLPDGLSVPRHRRDRWLERSNANSTAMAKIAKTADRAKAAEVEQGAACPECGKPTRIVKRVRNREMNVPGGMFLSCTVCDFAEKK